ncbi:PD-(D/E)XK motif protein [Caldimonas tepidiphila]|uniref:PD-(D/E)XK motif protein n=1 Tax=Caldimonas tepidiphila TaxID=2315841 RepID=UPI000E5C43FF|nr:PD-(D/E)XK motif protein [Caldimonas tepidiphila]
MPIDVQAMRSAWRALSGNRSEGWRTIAIGSIGPVSLMAGRQFPDNQEAVLVGFHGGQVPPASQLPQGHGFRVLRLPSGALGDDRRWVGLVRQDKGSLELFTMMVTDVLQALGGEPRSSAEAMLAIFLQRIKAWQEFMRRGSDGLLSPEEELGLAGELHFLGSLLDAGLDALFTLKAWQGPVHGSHDFVVGPGAIEVKATLAVQGFPARIGSLEQLDDSVVHPLCIAAVRFSTGSGGLTLPGMVGELRSRLEGEYLARVILDSKLLHAGYADAHSDGYTRQFLPVNARLLRVGPDFPRLIPATVPVAVRHASYELDLDLAEAQQMQLHELLQELGAI